MYVTLGINVRYIAPHGNMADAILHPRTLVNSRGGTLLETNCVIPSSAVIRCNPNLYYYYLHMSGILHKITCKIITYVLFRI